MQVQASNFLTSLKALLIWLIFWGAMFYLLLFSSPFLRFENTRLNYNFFTLLLLLVPFSLLWLGNKTKGFWGVMIVFIFSGSFILSGIIALLTSANISIDENGKDLGFEKISELRTDSNYYRLYRTNGGATTSFGLALRKEKPLLAGLKLVTPLKGLYPASKGRLEKLTSETARLIVLPDGYSKDKKVFSFKIK